MDELVEITDTRGKFKGLIRQSGSYASGEHVGTGDAQGKFVGSFDEIGNPLSGSLSANTIGRPGLARISGDYGDQISIPAPDPGRQRLCDGRPTREG